jgi:Holliday junction resolvase RusA-like endonuclease
MREPLVLSLDMPPSINALYATVERNGILVRVKSRAGRAWRKKAMLDIYNAMLQANWSCDPTAKIALICTLHFGRRGCDLDNRHKLLQDTLCEALGLVDDDQVDQIHKYRGDLMPDSPMVTVVVQVLEERAEPAQPKRRSREERIMAKGWRPEDLFGKRVWIKDGVAIRDDEFNEIIYE